MNCEYDVMLAKRVENVNDKKTKSQMNWKRIRYKQVEGRQKCNILFKTMKVNQRQEKEKKKEL